MSQMSSSFIMPLTRGPSLTIVNIGKGVGPSLTTELMFTTHPNTDESQWSALKDELYQEGSLQQKSRNDFFFSPSIQVANFSTDPFHVTACTVISIINPLPAIPCKTAINGTPLE